MKRIFNDPSTKAKRKELRRNSTPAEKALWSKLKGEKLYGYKFRRQHGVGKYILDFCCPELNLAIEVDGDSHFIDDGPERDVVRSRFIRSKGIRILRFTNADIRKNLEGVVITMQKAIEDIKKEFS